LVIGILEVVLASSFAALIFGGRGSVDLPDAIGFTLFGAIDVDRDAVLSSLTVVTAVIVASALTGPSSDGVRGSSAQSSNEFNVSIVSLSRLASVSANQRCRTMATTGSSASIRAICSREHLRTTQGDSATTSAVRGAPV
jgi:hypothetical protein